MKGPWRSDPVCLCLLLAAFLEYWGGKVLSSAPLKGNPNRVLTRMPSLTGTDSSSRWELLCVCEGSGLGGWDGGGSSCERARYLCAFIMRRQTSPVKLNNSLIFSHASMQECAPVDTWWWALKLHTNLLTDRTFHTNQSMRIIERMHLLHPRLMLATGCAILENITSQEAMLYDIMDLAVA